MIRFGRSVPLCLASLSLRTSTPLPATGSPPSARPLCCSLLDLTLPLSCATHPHPSAPRARGPIGRKKTCPPPPNPAVTNNQAPPWVETPSGCNRRSPRARATRTDDKNPPDLQEPTLQGFHNACDRDVATPTHRAVWSDRGFRPCHGAFCGPIGGWGTGRAAKIRPIQGSRGRWPSAVGPAGRANPHRHATTGPNRGSGGARRAAAERIGRTTAGADARSIPGVGTVARALAQQQIPNGIAPHPADGVAVERTSGLPAFPAGRSLLGRWPASPRWLPPVRALAPLFARGSDPDPAVSALISSDRTSAPLFTREDPPHRALASLFGRRRPPPAAPNRFPYPLSTAFPERSPARFPSPKGPSEPDDPQEGRNRATMP